VDDTIPDAAYVPVAAVRALADQIDTLRNDSRAYAETMRGFCRKCGGPITPTQTDRPDLEPGYVHEEDGRQTCPDGRGDAAPFVDMRQNGYLATLNGLAELAETALAAARPHFDTDLLADLRDFEQRWADAKMRDGEYVNFEPSLELRRIIAKYAPTPDHDTTVIAKHGGTTDE
jgi:hypothetical protein